MVALVIPTPYVCDHRWVQPRLAFGAMAAGAVLAAAGLAGCGGGPSSNAVGEEEWVANASGVIDQLNTDVSTVAPAGTGLPAAKRSLRDLSELYGLLVAYTDFGGCDRMVGGIGTAPRHFAAVVTDLERACVRFQDAAGLFTRAASVHDAPALLAASRQVKVASALLYRATLAFAAARARPGG